MPQSPSDRRLAVPLATSIAFLAISLGILIPRVSAQGITERVSVDSAGAQGDLQSFRSSISADGRCVAFDSRAQNLVPGDANQAWDVFVRDRVAGTTTRVSVDSAGTQGDGDSHLGSTPSISADGRFVAFSSAATNLVAGDANGLDDVFLHDRQTGATTRVSLDAAGGEGDGGSFYPSVSADGRFVAFESWATDLCPVPVTTVPTIYLHDRSSGQTTLVCVATSGEQANGYSLHPAISADGRFVAFRSLAYNFVPGDPSTIFSQIYVRDLAGGVTSRVSVSSEGAPARIPFESTFLHTDDPSISDDGRFVGFTSKAGNLVPGDDNIDYDVFVHDRLTATTTRMSVSSSGARGDGDSVGLRISGEGRYLAFTSHAVNLVPGDTNGASDAFFHDRFTGATTRVSVRSNGAQGNDPDPTSSFGAYGVSISADGRFVAFGSLSSNLVAGDSNASTDVFVHDRADPIPGAYGYAKVDSSGCVPSMSFAGLPSTTSAGAFDVRANPVQSGRIGFLFYSLEPVLERFRGGVLSIAPPWQRAAILGSGGTVPAHDCTGALAFDFNVRIQSGADPDLVPGTVVYAQYFYRDPNDASGFGTGISDALRFAIQP